jgi:cholesterol oxidase
MLSLPWNNRKQFYDFVVIGSGYGGAITAARIATANLNPKPSLCILERGREWPVGTFPDTVDGVLGAARNNLNPLGLYEFLNYQDISVIKGSGLGGTSLINANVAIVPDREIFERVGWPASIKYDAILPYYERAKAVLAATPHPRGNPNPPTGPQLSKVQALEARAAQIGTHAQALNIAVNFSIDGPNAHGVSQKPCIDCGDCVTGCNVSAKNTLYMNYLPMAQQAGAEIFTQAKVEWIEKLAGGGWRIHGKRYDGVLDGIVDESFTINARNVVVAAGAVNSTEILLRSEMHGLRVSPALGTCFSGNGDFFGLAYHGDRQTDVLGYGTKRTAQPGEARPPGPSIVGVVRYNGGAPVEQRITVEDFSFPSSYVLGAKAVFAALRGDKTVTGNEAAQRDRALKDLNPLEEYAADGALNHTMLYLVMGQDDARGTMVFDAPWFEPDGRMHIEWDKVGQQIVFTRMNEEVRRHARALGANFISNPTWSVFRTGHLITAHPLGGCPMGDDYLHGAVDAYGRVFSGDGDVHEGLFVADGSVVRSALGVNPFLTISALTEHIAERKIQELQGHAYPQANVVVSMDTLDAMELIGATESELERLFKRCATQSIDVLLNQGGNPIVDVASKTVRNDRYWKGFFPKGHILNAMSAAIFTGFKKEFHKNGLQYTGITSDTDGRIRARNSLQEISVKKQTGTLEPGEYILLRYLDLPWTGYYDILKVINNDLIIGRVYLGEYPNGMRVFTFCMTRKYTFAQMTVDDHTGLYASGSIPTAAELKGTWRMDIISNNNQLGGVAYLNFDPKPDGRLEARYQLMGLMEGLVVPSVAQDHFRMDDFTPFHDEIRRIDGDLMAGKYVTALPPEIAALVGSTSMGIFHSEAGSNLFGFYYTLTRAEKATFPTNRLLEPLLDVHLPDGTGMTFDEEMVGWYFEGVRTPSPDRAGDLTIANRIPKSGDPAGAVDCRFQVHMTVRDLNEFIEGLAHEASMSGTITFAKLQGQGPLTFTVDEQRSRFNYLRVNETTGEAEMQYHIEFRSDAGKRYVFEGRKYMQKDEGTGLRAIQEVLADYTTLFTHVYEVQADGTLQEIGTGYLKFRTFEDLAAIGNLAGFLGSFKVTGTDDPMIRAQGQMRFLAFTGQFVEHEYDPLAPGLFGQPLLFRGAGQG